MSARRTKVANRRSIYYRDTANGRRYEIGFTGSDGRQRWRTIEGGLREAEAALGDVQGRKRRGERVSPTRLTLAELAETWLAAQATRLRPKTLATYETHLRVHVLPRLGRLRVADVDEDDVAGLIAAMSEGGSAAWTVHGALTPLSGILTHAVRRGLIAANPVKRLERGERPATVARSEKRILGGEEIAALLDAALPSYRPLLATAVFTGLRLGELLGLVWADVDFEAGVLRVRKQLDRSGNRVEPKTRQSVRDVVLLPQLGQVLRQHRIASRFSGASEPVFASEAGTPLHWRNVSKRGLEKAVERAGLDRPELPRLTMHACRNTFASHLILDLKLDVVQVSKMLGHARPSITTDTYARLFEQARHADEIRDRMEASPFGKILESRGGEQWRNPAVAAEGEVAVLHRKGD